MLPLSYNDIAAGGAWQRRTPHATINVLRADQLELAEKKRNSPQLYTRNINKLLYDIGYKQLDIDLQKDREIIWKKIQTYSIKNKQRDSKTYKKSSY